MTRGLLACVVYRSLSGWLLAAPLALGLGAIVAGHPRGDAVLYERGGLWLFESARHLAPALGAIALSTGVLALIAAFGWLLPLSLLLAEIAGHRGQRALGAAAERLGTLSLLLGAYLFLEALVIGSALFSAKGGGVAAYGSFAFALLVLFALGSLMDAARTARFHQAEGAIEAVVVGARLLRPGVWWAGLWRGLISAAALGGGLVAAHFLAPTSAGAALLAPQLGVMGHLAARASWLVVLSRQARKQPLPASPAMQ